MASVTTLLQNMGLTEYEAKRILAVSAMEYGKCAKCMLETFEGGWHYAQKW